MTKESSNLPLRWGVLGTSMFNEIMISEIQNSPGSTVIAVQGRTPANLESIATKFDIPHRHPTVNALLEDPEVDIVFNGLPTILHKEVILAALARGKKRIVSEKPLARTWEEALVVNSALRSTDEVMFFEGYMLFFHPLAREIGEVVKSGKLGEIRSVQAHYSGNFWDTFGPPTGTSTTINMGVYPLLMIQWVMENAFGGDAFAAKGRYISGLGNVFSNIRGPGDGPRIRDAALAIQFANGVLAAVQSSDGTTNDFAFAAYGTKATLRCMTNPYLPMDTEKPYVLEIKTLDFSSNVAALENVEVQAEWSAFGYQVRAVEDGVRRGLREPERPAVGWKQSMEVVDVLMEWEDQIMKRWRGVTGEASG